MFLGGKNGKAARVAAFTYRVLCEITSNSLRALNVCA